MRCLRVARDNRIDVLRSLAILLIIIAHTNPPVFFQIRTVGVPMVSLYYNVICSELKET